jgi:hypothetical protein
VQPGANLLSYPYEHPRECPPGAFPRNRGNAQLAWGLESLEGKVKCLVSIGTRVPSLMDDVPQIGETLVALLDKMGRYYRFNMVQEIGLDEAKKVEAVAARRHMSSHGQMLAWACSISDVKTPG